MSYKWIKGLALAVFPFLTTAYWCFGGSSNAYFTTMHEIGTFTEPQQPDCTGFDFIQPSNRTIAPESEVLISWSPALNAEGYILKIFNVDTPLYPQRALYETTDTSVMLDTSKNNLGIGMRFTLQLEARITGFSSSCLVAREVEVPPSLLIFRPTHTPYVVVLPPSHPASCALTSPLEGLPNGVATFHWIPVPSATNYEIKLYNDQGGLLTTLSSPTTPLSADVSQNAIGGQYLLTMEFSAHRDGVILCSQRYTVYREAPIAVPAPNVLATVAPTTEPTPAPTEEETPDIIPEETPMVDCSDPEIIDNPDWDEYCSSNEW